MDKITELMCPLCMKNGLRENMVRNALSRADNETYICSNCGTAEALVNHKLPASPAHRELRRCLYYDPVGGIMLVTEDEPGYYPFAEHPKSEEFADQYCEAWNTKLGLTPRDVNDIVASSMFGRWTNF